MKLHQFLSIVPRPVKTGASAVMICAGLTGAVVGFMQGAARQIGPHGLWFPGSITALGFGLLVGLAIGAVISVWVLCLGFVYGDARRRSMPPVLWALIAALVPNLLGFLLYFALRRPFASPYLKCGQAMSVEQRFCSWCGHPGLSQPSYTAAPQPDPSGLGPSATG